MKILRKQLRDNYTIGLGKERIKGQSSIQTKFLDDNLKEVNNWIKPGHYDSSKTEQTKEAILKRIGRAESTKLGDKEFRRTISRLMK